MLITLQVEGISNDPPLQSGIYRSDLRDSLEVFLKKAEDLLEVDAKKANYYALKSEQICLSLKLSDKIAKAYYYSGISSQYIEDHATAKEYLHKALDKFEKSKDSTFLFKTYFYLGKNYYFNADYDVSLEFYHKALAGHYLQDSINDIASALQNIGLVHHNMDDFTKAKEYYFKAVEINKKINKKDRIAALYQNLGTIEYKNDNDSVAKEYYAKSLVIFEELRDTQGIATTYSNLGLFELESQNLDLAEEYFSSSYTYFEAIELKLGQIWTLFNLGVCNYFLKNYDIAEDFYQKSLLLSYSTNNNEGKLSNYEALSNLKEETNNFESALNYYKEYIAIGDTIYSQETQEKIAKLETKLSLDSSQKRLAEVDHELKRKNVQNKALISVFVVILFASIIVFYAYRQKSQAEKKLADHKADLEKIIEIRTRELEEEISGRRVAEESDKLKSAFLANMSHELRTPMNAIIAFSNFLRNPELTYDLRKEYLEHISTAGNSLLCLIDDIIDIAKIESEQLNIFIKATDLTRLMQDLHKVFEEIKKKKKKDHINLKLQLSDEYHYIINTDENRLKQIISNLLDNALKYSCKGDINFGFIAGEKKIEFFVEDCGMGIPQNKIKHIFKRFYQIHGNTDSRNSGTGLGLAICKNLVEILGGEIHVSSEFGKGSRFHFEIPVDSIKKQFIPKIKQETTVLEPIENNLDLQNKTILIAEDEELNYKVLDSFLSRTNANILRAKDGAKAIDIIKKEKIDLVLMDIQMPIMDGYDATKEIKKFNNRIPVIVQTSFAMEGEKEKCIDAGCDDFITKPLDLNLLIDKIRNFIY